ncbi:MAG: conjugative transposon protein TraJ [Flavobacteriaceae bacterium]|nr:MAG: conjugative transposon protein TraJ [Flavobacteriaceae bacterium]
MEFQNLHEVLRSLYDEMLPLSADMAAVAKGVAGLGALFYVAIKVWQALSRAEPIDMYPLLRPFALGICIMFFPTIVLGTINAVLSPVVQGTHAILENQVLDLNDLQAKKDLLEREAMLRNPETAYLVSNEEFDNKLEELGWMPNDLITMSGMYMDRFAYQTEQAIKNWFRNLLEVLFQAAALVIDTIRTFFLIVLSILGPIAFAISVWDGFQSTLKQWLTRYVSVYLWLPVADLFSSMLAKIQSLIIEKDIAMLADPTYIPDTSNTVYIIFMIIGIVGYFTIPTVTGWIIQAGGAGNFTRNVNQAAMKTGNIAGAGTGSAVGNIGGKLMGK